MPVVQQSELKCQTSAAVGLLLLLGLAISVLNGCQTYQFGANTLHRLDVRSIHVPIFDSGSFRQFLGQRLTEAVVKEIELNTPFVVTSSGRADSILRGRLVREGKRVLAENENDDPRTIQAEMQVEVTWTDRSGAPLMQRQVLRINRGVAFIPEGGQSLTTAQQEQIEQIARQIVGQMEVPW